MIRYIVTGNSDPLISGLADLYLDTDIEQFINQSFIQTLVNEGKTPSETQARATITGSTFEKCLVEIFDRKFPWINYKMNVPIPDASMSPQHGADFVIYDENGDIIAVIEAKGSAHKLEWPDGTVQEPPRPGLQRTDTIKKAVSQAYQVKEGLGDDVEFHILTSHKPTSGTAKDIYDQAVGDIIDSVVEVTNREELIEFGNHFKSSKSPSASS